MSYTAKTYELVTNPAVVPPVSFAPFFFNEPEYVSNQPCLNCQTFYWFHAKKQRADARFTVFVQDGQASSPCRAPFGSVELKPDLHPEDLNAFIEAVEQALIRQGVRQLHLKSYPYGYAPEAAATLTACLLQRGYRITRSELNYHLPVDQSELMPRLHISERRKLLKCRTAGFTFSEELQPDVAQVYQFVQAARARKGFPVSMDVDTFSQLFARFPNVYQVFAAKDRKQLIALTVTVRVHAHILYNFYPADDPAYLAYSPMVLLINGLYAYCQQQGISLLDLGIATDQGKRNNGLIQFKQFLGGKPSNKFSFEKRLG